MQWHSKRNLNHSQAAVMRFVVDTPDGDISVQFLKSLAADDRKTVPGAPFVFPTPIA